MDPLLPLRPLAPDVEHPGSDDEVQEYEISSIWAIYYVTMMIELLPTLITHSDLKLREGEAPMKDIYKILQFTKCEFCTYLIML